MIDYVGRVFFVFLCGLWIQNVGARVFFVPGLFLRGCEMNFRGCKMNSRGCKMNSRGCKMNLEGKANRFEEDPTELLVDVE